MKNKKIHKGAKILLLDIETSPMIGFIWSLWDQNVGLNQLKKDWFILSWSAKWLHDDKIYYRDQSKASNIENDKVILKDLWKLLDEADICVTQNGKKFDHKKINARFIYHGMKPPTKFMIIDTYLIAKRHFAFTSNRLEYLSETLNVKYKKMVSKKRKFQGFELWRECLRNNPAAWKEMKTYNQYDVLALEELFKKLIPWDNSLNLQNFIDEHSNRCNVCNGTVQKRGYSYTASGKYQRYRCVDCGAEHRSIKNLHSKDKRQNRLVPVK